MSLTRDLESRNKAYRLTRCEILTLLWVSRGYSNRAVAERLFVSRRTVDFHMSNVFKSLGAANRVQAIVIAERLGLIPNGPIVEPEPMTGKRPEYTKRKSSR